MQYNTDFSGQRRVSVLNLRSLLTLDAHTVFSIDHWVQICQLLMFPVYSKLICITFWVPQSRIKKKKIYGLSQNHINCVFTAVFSVNKLKVPGLLQFWLQLGVAVFLNQLFADKLINTHWFIWVFALIKVQKSKAVQLAGFLLDAMVAAKRKVFRSWTMI